MIEEFRAIPGYSEYAVSRNGTIKSIPRDIVLKQYLLNGYWIVDVFRGSPTETLPVHRAVALAWIENDNPKWKIVVNHKDGVKTNNWYENLEWVTYSENSIHAVNTGLRTDNIPCYVRDFYTGEVTKLNSIRQAGEFVGFPADSCLPWMLRKQFGALIKDRYEFRFENDPRPWFYENKNTKITPARYRVTVTNEDGTKEEIFSTKNLLKRYQLYKRTYGGTIPDLIRYACELYPDKQFEVEDSYATSVYKVNTSTAKKGAVGIVATDGLSTIRISSLREAAKKFNVSRITISRRLNTGIELNGWIFTTMLA